MVSAEIGRMSRTFPGESEKKGNKVSWTEKILSEKTQGSEKIMEH